MWSVCLFKGLKSLHISESQFPQSSASHTTVANTPFTWGPALSHLELSQVLHQNQSCQNIMYLLFNGPSRQSIRSFELSVATVEHANRVLIATSSANRLEDLSLSIVDLANSEEGLNVLELFQFTSLKRFVFCARSTGVLSVLNRLSPQCQIQELTLVVNIQDRDTIPVWESFYETFAFKPQFSKLVEISLRLDAQQSSRSITREMVDQGLGIMTFQNLITQLQGRSIRVRYNFDYFILRLDDKHHATPDTPHCMPASSALHQGEQLRKMIGFISRDQRYHTGSRRSTI